VAQRPPAGRFDNVLIGALAALVIAAHLLGATCLRRVFWGTDFFAFLPAWSPVVALLAGAGLALLALRLATRPPPTGPPRAAIPIATWTAITALSATLFWWLRIRHTLLGDAGPLSHNLPLGERTHPRQPLSLWIHHHAYVWTHRLFEAPGRSAPEVARHAVALDSVVAGVLLVPVAYRLAAHLVDHGPDAGDARGRHARDPVAVALAAGLLLAQGYMQLAFGYVENYTWFMLAIALYLWAGMRHLARGGSVAPASAALAAAIGLNISGIVFLPSLAALLARGLVRPNARRAAARDLALTLLAFLGLQVSLASLGGFSAIEGFRYMWDLVVRGEAADRSALYVWSWPHLRDFCAVQLLIGPFAGFFMAPAAARRLIGPHTRDGRLLFLLAAALPPFLAAWMYGDSIQGLPRDWDLFAPFAIAYTAAGIYCLASASQAQASRRRLLALAAVVSLVHTGAWVALNTSELRSLERYKTLPASRGRTEMVVGYWYLTHDERANAREWFQRAVAVYPANNLAQHELGLFAMDEGRYAEAIARFEIAVAARPDKGNYRLSLVDALVQAGRPAEALPQLERLTAAEPQRAELWGCTAIVLSGLGRTDQARQALERAIALAPGDSRYPRMVARLSQPDAYVRALREDWDALAVR